MHSFRSNSLLLQNLAFRDWPLRECVALEMVTYLRGKVNDLVVILERFNPVIRVLGQSSCQPQSGMVCLYIDGNSSQ